MSSNVIPGGLRSFPTSTTAISRSNGLLPESLSYTILSSSRQAEDGHPSAAAAVASSLDYRDRPIQTAGRKKEARPMALGNSYTAFTGNHTELNGDPDFDALVSPDGYISICGFGSLLSERSARSTFPDLKNFRIASLYGFRRVFCHVAPIFFERGIANEETGEISSLSVEPCEGETLVVTVFDVKRSEVPSFIEREHEFRFLSVVPEDLNGTPYSYPAVLCARYSDDEYFHVRCKGSKEILFKRYGQYNIHRIWRDDILPCRVYLRHCVLAAKNLGEAAYNNFVDHTFLSDRKTTIREYLSSTGSGIMEEEPPEALNVRYGG